MREYIANGKTVEEATEKACAGLGKSRDEVRVEILEMPVKKLFKSLPAKVKVTFYEEEADVLVPEKPGEKPVAVVKEASKPLPKPAEEMPLAKPEEKQNTVTAASEHKEAVLEKEPEIEINLNENQAAKKAVDYLLQIFAAMGAGEVKITAFSQGDATLLRVEGEDIAEHIETRGETIQALSYLTDRTVNRGVDKKEDEYLRVRLDIAGYRNRRERELISLAERTGREVAKTKRSRTLAPMNPYERLIIHTRISEMEGVTSESTGSDTERRVVVKSTAPDAKEGDDWQNGRGGKGGSGRRRPADKDGRRSPYNKGGAKGGAAREKQPRGEYTGKPQTNTPEREFAGQQRKENAEPTVPKRRDAITDGEDMPLYGKIEL